MTNEEAIKALKEVLKEDRETYQDFFINQGYADDGEIKRGLLALDKVIEALEKQTPRKPVEQDDGITYNCPACSRYVGYIDAMAWEMPKYCVECGQALEWSGVESV